MFGVELYIILAAFILAISAIALSYFSITNFYLIIIPFTLSTIIASIFYTNEPIWISGEIEAGVGSYLRGGLLLFSGFIGSMFYLRNARKHNFKISIHILLLLIFVLISLLSAFYSIDLKSTITRSILFLSLILTLVGLDYWLDSKEKFIKLLNLLFYIVSIILLLNLISMIAVPSRSWWWKTPSRLLGILSHPNELGGLCLVAFPIIFWKVKNSFGYNRYLTSLMILINLAVLIATGSRTSLIVSLVGIVIWLLVYKDWIKLISLTILLVLGIIFLNEIGLPSYTRNEGAKLTDLTERELIWQGASIFAKERPLIGYGYAVEGKIFDNQTLFDMEGQFFNANAQQPLHNGYLSVFIGGGIVGLTIWLMLLFLPIYYLIRSKTSKSVKAYALATLIPILIANIVESALTGYLSSTDIYFWLAWIIAGKIWSISKENNQHDLILDKA